MGGIGVAKTVVAFLLVPAWCRVAANAAKLVGLHAAAAALSAGAVVVFTAAAFLNGLPTKIIFSGAAV